MVGPTHLLTLVITATTAAAVNQEDLSACGRTLPFQDGNAPESVSAEIGQFPFMCILYAKYENSLVFLGGGSLLQNNLILTLASAVQPLLGQKKSCGGYRPHLNMIARCGSTDLQPQKVNEDEQRRSQDSTVQSIIVHPEYNNKSLVNDFAIIEVDTPFNYTEAVGRICLPPPDLEVPNDLWCTAAGHGKDGSEEYFIYTSALRRVNLKIWGKELCENELNEKFFASKDISWKIHHSHICAGDNENIVQEFGYGDTCEGDGGGPLVCRAGKLGNGDQDFAEEADQKTLSFVDVRSAGLGNNGHGDRFIQVGVVAWGAGPCGNGLPGVYSKVSDAVCWIEKVMTCNVVENDLPFDLRDTALTSKFTAAQCAHKEIIYDDTTCNCSPFYKEPGIVLQMINANLKFKK